MITAKFGGTAVTPQNLHCLKNILTKNHKCVVVSAVGKTFPRDTKTTDLLIEHFAGSVSAWGRIQEKYRRLVEKNCVPVDIDKLLFDAKARSRRHDLAYCMSLGEEMSAKVVAAYLGATYVEAADCVRFRAGKLDKSATYLNLKSAFGGVKCGVMGGFYGGCANNRQVFSRGGSDVSGALCAAATGSTLYENWTDSFGVCVANPKHIDGQTLESLSYFEMYALAKCGAEVLHPDAVKYAQRCGVPIRIANYLAPNGKSTVVSNCPSNLPLLCVSERAVGGGFLTTVLHNMPQQKVYSALHNLVRAKTANRGALGVCRQSFLEPSWQIATARHVVQIRSATSMLQQVYKAFETID